MVTWYMQLLSTVNRYWVTDCGLKTRAIGKNDGIVTADAISVSLRFCSVPPQLYGTALLR